MKAEILAHCRALVATKIRALKQEMADLQESADQDSKSSVGDKYETGRAMVQLEQENLMRQYDEFIKLNDILLKLNPSLSHGEIGMGSLVETNHGLFFMSVGLGKLDTDDFSAFAIAPNSPIGQALLGKKTGESITLNGRTYEIKQVN